MKFVKFTLKEGFFKKTVEFSGKQILFIVRKILQEKQHSCGQYIMLLDTLFQAPKEFSSIKWNFG